MAEVIDKEIEAIRTVLQALMPLSPEVRINVLDFVHKRLQIAQTPAPQLETSNTSARRVDSMIAAVEGGAEGQAEPTHIKYLKDKKKPRSASEMAALVAYYLANLAPLKDRKDRVTKKEIDTYFKIAEFPLPEKTQFTLPNAKAAGYLDAVGDGEYKLNAVGHNLVVHSMPRGPDDKVAKKRRTAKKARRATKKR